MTTEPWNLVDENSDLSGPVECLGMTFENDEKRREYFLDKLREKLKDPDFRKIEGFPVGSDEDILALSDPPYYTPCPNPFLEDYIRYFGKPYDPNEKYNTEPFAFDVTEGKNDPIYNAHTYHTKVPHRAIMRYIFHYSRPGDVVLDGFCGTGMTGVAAQACAHPLTDLTGEHVGGYEHTVSSNLGARRAILVDLSPAATFIAGNYNTSLDIELFERDALTIIDEVETNQGWMWETTHTDGKTKGIINNTVWSDVFICPQCSHDVVFFSAAVDSSSGKVATSFPCPHCSSNLTKRDLQRKFETHFDKWLNSHIKRQKRVPVLINYHIGRKSYKKIPDTADLQIIENINQEIPSHFVPTFKLMFRDNGWGDTWRAGVHSGITHAHHFYFERTLWALSELKHKFEESPSSKLLGILFTSQLINISKMNRYRPNVSFPYNPMSGTLYVGSQICESNPFVAYRNKIKKFILAKSAISVSNSVAISTQSSSCICNQIPENSIDYIFIDPPFGDNLPYSELSFLWESWLRIHTNSTEEAIISGVQKKGIQEYLSLMEKCFSSMYKCLKPGRWMTVEFHNSHNAVWNAIQEALGKSGFVVEDVRILDKGTKTKKQISGANAVKQDLVISSYKPSVILEQTFELHAGSEEGVWEFVRTHLSKLPIFVVNNSQDEIIVERQNFLLFDRMVAFHVQRGVTVPISSADFYVGLINRYPERDGMYFLPEQVAEYDKKRVKIKDFLQLSLFVSDEESAIQWLKQQLSKKPQSFQELHPQFIKEIGGGQKHERPLELSEILEQNFLRYTGAEDVPSQIHSYLSTNFKELRNLSKNDSALRAKAKNRWYVPDPNKAGDLEKLRERTLLREFSEYLESKQRRLKVFRLEAVRAGFKKAGQERDYSTIISVARKIPETVLQEDPKLLMWYDQALTRTGEE